MDGQTTPNYIYNKSEITKSDVSSRWHAQVGIRLTRSKDIFVHVYFTVELFGKPGAALFFYCTLSVEGKYGMAEWEGVWNRLLILHRKYHRVVVTA